MKNVIRIFAIFCTILVGVVMNACTKDNNLGDSGATETPELTVSVEEGSVACTNVVLNFEAKGGVNAAAYVVGGEKPAGDVLFAKGKVVALKDGVNKVSVWGLTENSDNVIWVVGAKDDTLLAVQSVNVVTPDFNDSVECELVDLWDRGYKVRLNAISPRVGAPIEGDNVTEENIGTALRWQQMSYFLYNMRKANGEGLASMLDQHPGSYPMSVVLGTKILTIDEYHSYERDENGNLLYTDWLGNPLPEEEGGEVSQLYSPLVPGQPSVFLWGEFAYDPEGEHIGNSWYYPGYCVALFDWETYISDLYGDPWGDIDPGFGVGSKNLVTRDFLDDKYWLPAAQHGELFVRTTEPKQLPESDFQVEVSSTPCDIVIKVAPSQNVGLYSLLVLEEDTYNMVVEQFLAGHTEYLQWFTSSYEAMMLVGAMQFYDASEISMEEYLYLTKDVEYHVLINAIGTEMDSDGNYTGEKQCFKHFTTKLAEPTLPAPKMSITAVPQDDPYKVGFLVKKAADSECEITSAKYLCNDLREWPANSDDSQMLSYYGQSYNPDDVEVINSAEGLLMVFPTYEDTEVKCVVVGTNVEGTDSEVVSAICRSSVAPLPEKIDSPYYTSLQGDWTATATIVYERYAGYDPDTWQAIYEPFEETVSTKITIGDISYPATLTDDVYQIYEGIGRTKEQVDADYEVLKAAVDKFNNTTAAYNRILCNGFEFAPSEDYYGSLAYQAPYDLFTSLSYNGKDGESPVWDFGPKWYLEVQKDGSLAVPFNASRMAPLAAHNSNKYWLVAASDAEVLSYLGEEGETGYFPVEVSADGNTITIKSLKQGAANYYPQAAYVDYFGMWNMYRVTSEIILTRGYNGVAAKTAKKSDNPAKGVTVGSGAENVKFAVKPYAMTPIKETKAVKFNKATYTVLSKDSVVERVKTYCEKFNKKGARK